VSDPRTASGARPTRRAPESWLARRWRQARNPPPPVLRAVLANIAVAGIGGVVLLAGALGAPQLDPAPLVALFVLVVVGAGSLLTYLWVELPTAHPGSRTRSRWAALLGLFAAVPICYLALVVIYQVALPLLD
jgi:hypothetical protein